MFFEIQREVDYSLLIKEIRYGRSFLFSYVQDLPKVLPQREKATGAPNSSKRNSADKRLQSAGDLNALPRSNLASLGRLENRARCCLLSGRDSRVSECVEVWWGSLLPAPEQTRD